VASWVLGCADYGCDLGRCAAAVMWSLGGGYASVRTECVVDTPRGVNLTRGWPWFDRGGCGLTGGGRGLTGGERGRSLPAPGRIWF